MIISSGKNSVTCVITTVIDRQCAAVLFNPLLEDLVMRRAAKLTVIGLAGIMLIALIAAVASAGDVPVIARVQESILATTCKVSTSAYGSTSKECSTETCETNQPAGSVGTGFAFFKSDEYVWVMTNRHVVGANSQGKTVYTTWWTEGRQSLRVPMILVAVSQKYDVAIGRIKVALFGQRLPRIIPLADTTPVKTGDTILTAGCPRGDWLTATQGHVVKPVKTPDGQQTAFAYLPVPRFGRSGSPIFNAEGTKVVGLCYLRVGSKGNMYGRAYSTIVLRSVFPSRAVLIDGQPKFLFARRRDRCCPEQQGQQESVVPANEGIYPSLPNIDVEVMVEPAKPEIKQVGWVAPTVISGITLVFGFVIILGRQLFGKLGK